MTLICLKGFNQGLLCYSVIFVCWFKSLMLVHLNVQWPELLVRLIRTKVFLELIYIKQNWRRNKVLVCKKDKNIWRAAWCDAAGVYGMLIPLNSRIRNNRKYMSLCVLEADPSQLSISSQRVRGHSLTLVQYLTATHCYP